MRLKLILAIAGFGLAASASALATSTDGFAKEMAAAMQRMHHAMMVEPSGDVDRDFAAMMVPHHQGAIDMAQMELKSGKDAKMRAMAKGIIKAQQKEIKEFDRWLGKQK